MRTTTRWQERALHWASARDRCAFFLDMRLGKCLTAIRWARGHTKPLEGSWLIVAPLTTLPGWWSELLQEGERGGCIVAEVPKADRSEVVALADWSLVSFEFLLANPWLSKQDWAGIIVDESARLRNPRAKLTKFLRRRFPHVHRRAVLSGLAAPEGDPLELFEQMAFVYGAFGGCDNYWQFREKYFQLRFAWSHEWEPISRRVIQEVVSAELIAGAFTLTRAAAGVKTPKHYERWNVARNGDEIAAYHKLERSWVGACDEAYKYVIQIAHAAAQLLTAAKLRELPCVLADVSKPVVVWAWYVDQVCAAAAVAAEHGYRVGTVQGTDSARKRADTVARFQKGGLDVLVANPACAEYGLNLSRASAAVYFSNPWSGNKRRQSEDRIVHLKKSTACRYVDMVCAGTIDDDLRIALRLKKAEGAALFASVLQHARTRMQEGRVRRVVQR